MLQPEIAKACEYRVYVIGGEVVPCRTSSNELAKQIPAVHATLADAHWGLLQTAGKW